MFKIIRDKERIEECYKKLMENVMKIKNEIEKRGWKIKQPEERKQKFLFFTLVPSKKITKVQRLDLNICIESLPDEERVPSWGVLLRR